MKTFKPGDRVIVDNTERYDVGVVNRIPKGIHGLFLIDIVGEKTMIVAEEFMQHYSIEKIEELALKYGYRKQFED